MTKAEFSRAFALAKSSDDLSHVDDSTLWGCGLPGFVPVTVTLEQVAKFIKWQSFTFAGGIDAKALDECATIARHKFLLADK